ncbi:Protein CASP [Smittium mucronatum]|uniref:Protein CASP n=1 Tax=Smittium mucronatum TaxID=133383 RepID=A0A1R0GUA3_9FUNG|nr:Protein CASP [Smittium mucronatum]
MEGIVTNDEISVALDSWKDVGLTKLLLKYGDNLETILENQKESVKCRRDLAEKTKDFRRQNEALNTPEIKALLKAYQNEIDNLSKKMKYSENTFIGLFKILNEAPDPEPFLSRLSMEELVNERVEIRENELKEEASSLIQYLKNREKDLQQQLSETTQNLELLRDNHNMTQAELLELSQNKDRDLTVRVAELDIVQAELERANSKLISLSNENNSFKAEIKALKEGVGASSIVLDLQNRLKNQEEEISRLVSEVDNSMQEHALNESLFSKKTSDLESALNSKSVEFSGGWGADEDSIEGNSKSSEPQLEKMLIKKNQNLQNLLTDTKNELSDTKDQLKEVNSKFLKLESDLNDKSNLIIRLEQDLISVGSEGSRIARSSDSIKASSEDVAEKLSSDNLTSVPNGISNSGKSKTPDSAILSVITGQRDRFRQRNFELEEV